MDEFEQRSRKIAQTILERHDWKHPMTTEVKEMREIVDLPYTECKRYLVEEWQNMRVPLLEKENAKLRELARDVNKAAHMLCEAWEGSCSKEFEGMSLHDVCPISDTNELCVFGKLYDRMCELGIEVE